MKASFKNHQHRKYKLFVSNEIELLLFNYEYGKSSIFIKFIKPIDYRPDVTHFRDAYEFEKWYELPGGSGGANGYDEHGGSDLPLIKRDDTMRISYYTKLMNKRTSRDERLKESDLEFEAVVMINYKTVVCDWHIMHQFKLENEEIIFNDSYVPLPEDRKLSYTLKSSNSKIFVITDNLVYNSSYDSEVLRIGNPIKGMKEYKIKSFDRFRDGGTTIIRTEEGIVLFMPTSFNAGAKSSIGFENKELFTSEFAVNLFGADQYEPSEMYKKYVTDKEIFCFDLIEMDEATKEFYKQTLNENSDDRCEAYDNNHNYKTFIDMINSMKI